MAGAGNPKKTRFAPGHSAEWGGEFGSQPVFFCSPGGLVKSTRYSGGYNSSSVYMCQDILSRFLESCERGSLITLAGIACIIMREVYATIGESIYPNPSFMSRDFPEASGRLLRNLKEFTFQDMAN